MKFSKALRHIDMKDVKNKRLQKESARIKEEKKKEDTKKYIASAMEQVKYNWRSTFDSGAALREGMTTSDVATISVPPKEGDGVVSAVNAIDASSYVTQVTNILGDGVNRDGNIGSVIRNSGAGTGQDGGFNVGGQYLSFQGDGYNDTGHALRWAGLAPIDSTEVDTLEITAIVGNDSNGGEDPDAEGEELYVMYQTPAMDQPHFLIQNPDGSIAQGKSFNSTDDIIIPLGASNNSGLNKYAVEVPDYARAEGTQFILIQVQSSGTGYDNYGITNINFQRKAPVNVVVPLDNPEASSFIRGAEEGSSPKKRKKDVNDQLEASDEYTQAQLGDEFPGGEVRVGGEDPFASAKIGDDVEPSPQSKDEVIDVFSRVNKSDKKSFIDFKDLTDQQKVSQSDEFINDYIKTFYDDTYTDPESIAILDRAIELNPENIDAYFYRSFAHLDNQNYEDALKDTEKILEVDPNDPDVSYVRMIIYQEKGDLELSLEELKKTLETYPDDTYLQDMKADIENQIEQEYRAKQVPPDANEEGGVVKRQTYYDDVSEKLAPEDTEDQQLVSTNLAQAKDLMTSTHYSFGRDGVFSKGAIELLQDAYAVEPNNPEILSNLGVALMMGGKAFDGEGGEYYLERAQALDPSIKFDFNINSWDRYDGEEQQPYAGPRIDRLASLPYRYARDIIKNLPDQSTAKGAKYGATDDYAKNYGGSYSKYYTDEAKGKSTQVLQRMLVDAARKIEDNKYWMEDLSRHPSFKGNDDIIGVPGYALGATKWTGALTGKTLEDWRREEEKLDAMVDEYGYYQGDWRSQWEKARKTLFQANADSRSKAVSAGVKADVEKYKAYYDEYMRRGEPDAIEKVDVPEAGKFIDTAQKEIIEKAISEPEKLFKLSEKQAETLRKVLTPQGGKGGDSLEYTANLPFALGISILTGKPMELFVSEAEAIKIAQDINADELAKVLRIDNPVPVTARETIEPSEGKTDQVIKSLFGSQGGLYFNYDTETKQLYIESRKTLRSTSGGEEVTDFFSSEPPINPKTGEPFPDMYADKNADLKSILFTLPTLTGTGSKFSDIPVPTTDKINEIGAKFVFDYVYGPFMKAKATFDALKKTGGNPIEIKNVIFDGLAGKIENPDQLNPDAPRDKWNAKAGKMMNSYDYAVAGMKQHFDQNFISKTVVKLATDLISANVNAIAANTVAIRKILTDIGVPASDIEKFGGAYGMTYSSTPVNYDNLPDDVKAVIDAAVGTPQGKPKEEPKDGSDLGSAGEIGGVDATAAATAAATTKKKKKKGKVNESNLYEKLKKGSFFNPKDIKPIFPENPPPKLDPKTGMHPQYGKKAGRYKKLDPHSANSMPPTGDPEIDAVVNKQKTINKIKKMAKKNLKESAFSNITVGNKVGQTFQHASGATITLDGALGGKMMVPSQVTLDLGFGEKITVDGPTESDFGLAGYTKPLDSKLQKRIADQSVDEINDKLDASQEASGAETAKVSEIPSETTFPEMPSEAEMEANYEKFREGNPDLPSFSELTSGIQLPEIPTEGWTYDQYVAMANAIRAQGAAAEEPIAKQILDYSPTGTKIHLDKFGQRNTPIGLIDAQSAITNAVNRALDALHQAWLAYNKVPDLPPVSGEGEEELSTEDDEKFLNKQQTLVNLTRGLGAIGLPNDFAQWTINYAKGDMTPITKFSPGMERQVRNLVLDKFKKNPNATTVSIQYDDYGYGFKALSTRLGLGRFTATKLNNGKIRIQDTFNVDKDFTNIGSASIVPGLQDTANRLVDISYKNRNLKGRTDEGGITVDVLIDSGFVKKKKKVNESTTFSKVKKMRKKA